MLYDELIELISKESGVPKYKCKQVMNALPKALTGWLKPGDHVKTPLGSFFSKFMPPVSYDIPPDRKGVSDPSIKIWLRPYKTTMRCWPTNPRWLYMTLPEPGEVDDYDIEYVDDDLDDYDVDE